MQGLGNVKCWCGAENKENATLPQCAIGEERKRRGSEKWKEVNKPVARARAKLDDCPEDSCHPTTPNEVKVATVELSLIVEVVIRSCDCGQPLIVRSRYCGRT